MFLHWLSAAVILWASFTGFIGATLPQSSAARHFFGIVNPQIATLFIPFFVWRLALYLYAAPWTEWRSANTQEQLALLVHGLLYATITLVLASGLLMMPTPWRLLGFIPMPVLGAGHTALMKLHNASCMGLSGLVLLHLAAVFYHVHKKYRRASSPALSFPTPSDC